MIAQFLFDEAACQVARREECEPGPTDSSREDVDRAFNQIKERAPGEGKRGAGQKRENPDHIGHNEHNGAEGAEVFDLRLKLRDVAAELARQKVEDDDRGDDSDDL